jgi:hypothetical protein
MNMSSSNKSDATATIGTILDESGQRDAIHVAVISVIASQSLKAGEDVGFLEDGTVGKIATHVGVVDPFLKSYLKKGDKFWLAIYPRQVTGLRHVWTHPTIPDESEKTTLVKKYRSEEYIQELADEVDLSYQAILNAADNYVISGRHIVGGDEMEGKWVSDEFWDHYENVTGKRVWNKNRGNFFSCSC